MPARNPEAVRQRAIDAARQRSGRPATPSLDPAFVALNRDELPVRARSGGELAERVRRAEDYAVLGARVVVELHSESHATKPSTRAWAIAGRADRQQRGERRQADRTSRPTDSPRGGWLLMPDNDPSHPDQLDGDQRCRADLVAYLDSLPIGELAELLGELPGGPSAAAGAGCAHDRAERAAARRLQASAARRAPRPE
jgi:hypothetical protein